MNERTNLPIACTLSTLEQTRATDAYKAGLFRHATKFRPREHGASVCFDWNIERIDELGQFLAVETSCCAFMDHAVEFPRGKKHIWLHFTWPEEAGAGMRAELRAMLPPGIEADSPAPAEGRGGDTRSWLARAGVGFTGIGLLSLACCVAPALGVTALAAGGASLITLVDPIAGAALAIAVALLVWWKLARRKTGQKTCCRAGC